MKIELIKQTIQINGESVAYKYKELNYCCEKLRDNAIVELSNELPSITNGIPQMMLHTSEEFCEWGEEYEEDYWYPIGFCPFCGEPIEIEVLRTEDNTERYKDLIKQYEEIQDKWRNTDSIRMREQWEREMCDLSNQLDDLFEVGKYKDREQIKR